MKPKSSINYKACKLYTITPEGLVPLEVATQEVEFEPESTEQEGLADVLKLADSLGSFTLTIKISGDFIERFLKEAEKQLKWENLLRRLRYLALHGKNRRIRKKNYKRFIREWSYGIWVQGYRPLTWR